MNNREKILVSMVIVCIIVISALIVGYHNLNNNYIYSVEISNEFWGILESEGENVPKIFVGEKYLFGEQFNSSNWSNYSKMLDYLKKYSNHLFEVVEFMKFQVYSLGEDPELFEKCLYALYDFKNSIQSDGEFCLPYIAWKGKYADCPIAIHTPGEPSKYDNEDVWAITLLYDGMFGIQKTYYVDTETIAQLPVSMVCN